MKINLVKVSANKKIVGIELISENTQKVFNIDGQHYGGLKSRAACMLVWHNEIDLKIEEIETLLIERIDPDALAAACLIEALQTKRDIAQWKKKIFTIAGFDEYTLLPEKNPEAYREFAALSAAVSDYTVPFEQAVQLMRNYLEVEDAASIIPQKYFDEVDSAAEEVKRLQVAGLIEVKGDIVIVRQARAVRGIVAELYKLGKVVVIEYPEFPGRPNPFRKFTVAIHPSFLGDLRPLWKRLQTLEKELNFALGGTKWDGQDKIGGSPNGVSTLLSVDVIAGETEAILKRPQLRSFMKWLLVKEFDMVTKNPWQEYCQELGSQPNSFLGEAEQRAIALLERTYAPVELETVPASHVAATLMLARLL